MSIEINTNEMTLRKLVRDFLTERGYELQSKYSVSCQVVKEIEDERKKSGVFYSILTTLGFIDKEKNKYEVLTKDIFFYDGVILVKVFEDNLEIIKSLFQEFLDVNNLNEELKIKIEVSE